MSKPWQTLGGLSGHPRGDNTKPQRANSTPHPTQGPVRVRRNVRSVPAIGGPLALGQPIRLGSLFSQTETNTSHFR